MNDEVGTNVVIRNWVFLVRYSIPCSLFDIHVPSRLVLKSEYGD